MGTRAGRQGWRLGCVALVIAAGGLRAATAPLSPYEPLLRQVQIAPISAEAAPVYLAPRVFAPSDLAPPLRGVQDRPLLLARLRAGDTSPESLARLRAVPTADLWQILEATPWPSTADQKLVDRIVEVLLEQNALPAELPGDLSYNVAMNLAFALARLGDEHCVALCEGLLARRNEKVDGAVPELMALGEFYRRIHQADQAAAVFLRGAAYTASPGMVADYQLEAARDLYRAGQTEAAEQLYTELAAGAHGNGWVAGMALYDQAHRLVMQGRTAEARGFLTRTVTGTHADQIQVALDYLLGYSYFRDGQIELARRYCNRAVSRYAALPAPLDREGLGNVMASARRCLEQLEQGP